VKPLLNKEEFIKIIENIQKQEEIHDKITDALDCMYEGRGFFMGSELYHESLMKLLKIVMNDIDEYISWWLYEDVEKKVWYKEGDKKIEIDLTTSSKLYDYLIENYVLKNNNK